MSRTAVLSVLAGVLLLIVCLVVGAMFVFGFGLFSNSTANFRGNVNQTNQIQGNGSYRIAAYDHFYNLCATVQTDEGSIAAVADELKTATDPQRKLVLDASLTSLRIKRIDDINQYNADARKDKTLGQFKASNLPYPLDPTQEKTVCTVN